MLKFSQYFLHDLLQLKNKTSRTTDFSDEVSEYSDIKKNTTNIEKRPTAKT